MKTENREPRVRKMACEGLGRKMAPLIPVCRENENAIGFPANAKGSCVVTGCDFVAMANSAPNVEEIGAEMECVANGSPVSDQEGWVRLVAYGQHPQGEHDVQVFDRQAAESMVERFRDAANGFIRRLLRANPARPIYRGHPDHPHFAAQGHDDFTVQGEAPELEARDDGLYMRPTWTEAGKTLLATGQKLYYSPRWVTRKIGERAGKALWQPTKLMSIGLTPTPNIYGSAANSLPEPTTNHDKTMDRLKKLMEALMKRLGYNDTEATAFANAAEGAPTDEAILGLVDAALQAQTDFANEQSRASTLETELQTERTARATAEQALAAAQADFANERQARASLVVGDAVARGIVSPASVEAEAAALAGAADFANAAKALLARSPILPTGGGRNLGARKGEVQDIANAQGAFDAALRDFANERGLDLNKEHDRAYRAFLVTEQGKTLYAKLREGKAE